MSKNSSIFLPSFLTNLNDQENMKDDEDGKIDLIFYCVGCNIVDILGMVGEFTPLFPMVKLYIQLGPLKFYLGNNVVQWHFIQETFYHCHFILKTLLQLSFCRENIVAIANLVRKYCCHFYFIQETFYNSRFIQE